MAVSRSGRQVAGQDESDRLAYEVMQKIRDREYPCGTQLAPVRLAAVMNACPRDLEAALGLLESRGATIRNDNGWVVRADRKVSARDILLRGQPLLVTAVRLAVKRIKPAEIEQVEEAYGRYTRDIWSITVEGREQAYRDLLTRIACSSRSQYHLDGICCLLDEAGPMISKLLADAWRGLTPVDPDNELARLVGALKSGDEFSAQQAIEDHLLVIGQYMDRVMEA